MLHKETIAPGTLDILKKICLNPWFNDFSLAGGTALALQIGHRISVDLDFFGKKDLIEIDFQVELLKISRARPVSIAQHILIFYLNGVKVDFVNYPFPPIAPLLEIEGIRMQGLNDIAAMKLSAITNRGRKRDFYDLYFLLDIFSLQELFDFYSLKFNNASELLVLKSLAYFDDAEKDEDPDLIKKGLTWEGVKKRILTALINKK